MTDPRRLIPGVDRIVEDAALSGLLTEYPRDRVMDALRRAVEQVRSALGRGESPGDVEGAALYEGIARDALKRDDVPSLRSVVNATGVILHTNLGRAPLADAATEAMRVAGAGYTNLEFDLVEGVRGSRYEHCVELLTELTAAEDGLVVNNNAAALVLALSALARGTGVIVSRGELVEIGGGFRIPEILEQSGAELIEVGSTNRTRLRDYSEAADSDRVGAILKVHRSNFRISGFTEEASLEDLVSLGRDRGLHVIHDLGSGLLIESESLGLPFEPRPRESVAAGVDLVAFSGDKLTGGPQAGLIAGKAEAVARLRECPLCRAVRVDKTTLAGIEATLKLYRDPARAVEEIPVLRMLSAPLEVVESRARAFAARVRELPGVAGARVAELSSVVGGGTYPEVEIPSSGVVIESADASVSEVAAGLRRSDPPVVARVEGDALVFDFRTLLEGDAELVERALQEALSGSEPAGTRE